MEVGWRKKILTSLQERNRRENEAFSALILAHSKLLQNAESFRAKNIQLTVEAEKLKQENLELQIKLDSGVGNGGIKGEKTHALEQRVFKLQEEMLEIHAKKNENAQHVIDLNNAVQEKDKELNVKEARIQELLNTIRNLTTVKESLEQKMQELITTNQMLTDEQQALQLAFTSLEEKFRKAQDDNNDLVTRWMAIKSQAADKMNAENDTFIKTKQATVKALLKEAQDTHVDIDIPNIGPNLPMCSVVTIPNRSLCTFEAHESEVNAVKWSTSGRLFATGGSDRKVKLWEVNNGKCESKGVLAGCNAAVMSLDFDWEDNLLLGTSNDFASRVWTVSDQRLRHTLTGHSGKVLTAKFLGDANRVVSGSHDRTLKLWDLRSKVCVKTSFAGSSCNDLVTCEGTTIISGHFDRKLRFWDTRSLDSPSNEINLQGRICSVDISPDRDRLLACSRDDTIKLIDLRRNQVTSTLSADGFRPGNDWMRACFSPDGSYVMAGSVDGVVYIWNVLKGTVEKTYKEHNHAVMACSWNPQGSSLLSCDRHRSVILWADF